MSPTERRIWVENMLFEVMFMPVQISLLTIFSNRHRLHYARVGVPGRHAME
jgi:hypothetical protein